MLTLLGLALPLLEADAGTWRPDSGPLPADLRYFTSRVIGQLRLFLPAM